MLVSLVNVTSYVIQVFLKAYDQTMCSLIIEGP